MKVQTNVKAGGYNYDPAALEAIIRRLREAAEMTEQGSR
jgi:hypothetical protein